MSTFELIILALKITCVPATALAGHLILRRRSAATRHLVLALGLAGVILVPVLALGVPSWKLEVLPAAAKLDSPASLPAPASRLAMEPETAVTAKSGATLEFIERSRPAADSDRAALPAAHAPDTRTALLAIWMLGAGVLLAHVAAGLLRLRWIARRGAPVREPDILEQLESCRRMAGLKAAPELIATAHIDVPVVWGWLRPNLLLPASFAAWPEQRREMVLLHELGHLKRSDWPVLLMGRLVTCFYWFHPLVWSLERRARRECERACDDLVVRCGMKPSDYAQHLLSIARGLSGRNRVRTALAVLRPHGIKDRLTSILNPVARRSAPNRLTVVLAVLGLLALLLPLASVELATAVQASGKGKNGASEPAVEHCEEHGDGQGVTDPAGCCTEIDVADLDDPADAEGLADLDDLADLGDVMWADNSHARRAEQEEGENDEGARDFGKAYELHQQERWSEAIESFERAATLGHRPATALYNIACGYARMGDKSKALEYLEKASTAGFDSLEYIDEDDDLDPLRSDPRFQKLVDRLYEEAGEVRDRDDDPYRETLAQFEELQRDHSTDAGEWYEVGVRLLQMREFPAAIQALGAAVEHSDQDSTTAMYNLACAHSLAGNEDEAVRWLERAVTAGFDRHERFVNDTDLNNVRDTPQFKRIAEMSEALSMESFSRKSWERSDYSEERWAPAVERYTEFTAKHADIGRGWFNLAYALHYSERFDEAIAALKKADALGYRPGTTAYNLACANAKLGRTEAALEALEQAQERGFEGLGYLEEDEDLESLRSDPRFKAMLEEQRQKHSKMDSDDEQKIKRSIENKIERKIEKAQKRQQAGTWL